MKGFLTTREAGAKLRPPVTASRIVHLIRAGRIEAQMFGGSYLIPEAELKKIAVRRPGRPKSLK